MVVVLEVEGLELALLVLEVVERGGAQSLHRPARVGGTVAGRVSSKGRHGLTGLLEGGGHDAVLGIHLRQEVSVDAGTLEVRPRHLVLALVVVGELVVEVLPGAPQLGGPRWRRRHGRCRAR